MCWFCRCESTGKNQAARGHGPSQQWLDWQNQAKSFEAIAAYEWTFNFLVLPNGSESLEGMVVTKDYFQALGLKPMLGRTFVDSEDGTAPANVIILGYNLWQRSFSGDPNIVGKIIHISRQDPLTVIGVMPPGIRFLPSPGASKKPNYSINTQVDFWEPVLPNPNNKKQPSWDIIGRLKPGATVDGAQAELRVIISGEAQAEKDFEGVTAELQPLTTEMNRDGSRILLPLFGAAAWFF